MTENYHSPNKRQGKRTKKFALAAVFWKFSTFVVGGCGSLDFVEFAFVLQNGVFVYGFEAFLVVLVMHGVGGVVFMHTEYIYITADTYMLYIARLKTGQSI